MTSIDRQKWLTCWSVSILLHTGLLILGLDALTQTARFSVQAGETSIVIDLISEPAPAQTAQPVPLSSNQLPPFPAEQAIPIFKSVILITPSFSKSTFAPAIATTPFAKPPSKLSIKSKMTQLSTLSPLSRGATEAHPNDLHNDPPVYPEESRRAREEGTVILQVDVTANGEPSGVSILKSSGSFRLDQAARHAVQHWKFHAALTAGVPVASEAAVPVHFKLQ